MANPLSYTNYDFDSLVSQLQDRLGANPAWADIYRSATGQTLIELLAYVVSLNLFFVERRAEESYLPTAQNRSSVVNLVSLLNYTPKRKTSSTGNLQFSIVAPLTKIVYIPKYTECQTSTGIKFLTNQSGAIQKGQTSVTLEGIQGSLVQKEIVSSGAFSQEYAITSTSVENSGDSANPSFRVIVDGVEWTLVTSFLDSTSTSTHYKLVTEKDGSVSVLFGDNINGKAPEIGNTILIQYIESDGSLGNVSSLGAITTLNNVIYDSSNAAVTVTVTNTSLFLGGDAEEDIEEIRSEAPQVFKTGDRAVTRGDFVAILRNMPGVADANVWGENEEALAAGTLADYEMLNKVKIVLILTDWQLADSTFKSAVSETLYENSMLTVKYEFVEPTIINVIPCLDVKVATGHSMSQTQTDIEEILEDQFLLGSTTKLGTTIRYSNVLAAIDNLEGVAYATMSLEAKSSLSASYSSGYDWGTTLELLPIKPETTRLFLDGVESVTDVDNGNDTGTFTASGVSGTINYLTGAVNIDASATTVYVRYQQDEGGNLIPGLNGICKLEEVDVYNIEME